MVLILLGNSPKTIIQAARPAGSVQRGNSMYKKPRALAKRLRSALFAAAAVLVAGLIGIATPAAASTPDGQTPANEGVCDELQGATPGLYGLCVAYCEAQDLDSVTSGKTPSEKILANYRKKMRDGDPDMPCVQTPCPCWDTQELASMSTDGLAAACTSTTNTIEIIDNSPTLHRAGADIKSNSCLYINLNVSPPRILGTSVTADEAQACYSAIQQTCSSLGL